VLLDADYIARLADFGHASLVGNVPEALTYLQRSTAQSGALRWIAPEQVDPEGVFNRTTKNDIYSFGCVALQERWLVTNVRPKLIFIFLQVLSGKQPGSEVGEDSAIVLRLAKGHTPGRPESRMLNDLHWSLIQDCWSAIEERPAAEVIISTIKQFLSHCSQSPPLCDLLLARSSEADFGAESLLFASHTPTDGSRTHATQAASDEDDQNRYIAMIILVHSIMLTPRHLHLPASHRFSDVTSLNRPPESEKHRLPLTGKQPSTDANEQHHHKRRRV